ncbi:MAG: gliding motility-associated C-terminal domain-containing protein [Flavobacteriales bacterium]
MQDNFNTYSLIEDYLSGNLSYEETIAFEKQLESNPELKTLVDDYSLVDVFIEKNELIAINNKLTHIHTSSLLKKKLLIGLGATVILAILIISFITFSKNKMATNKFEIKKETSKSIDNIIAESTPFKIIDSTSEAELTRTIEERKAELTEPILTDSLETDAKAATDLPETSTPFFADKKKTEPNSAQRKDSSKILLNNQNPQSVVVRKDSVKKIKCNVVLEKENIIASNSCSEKRTGAIQFTQSNPELVYSINNKQNYSSKPYFSSLSEGKYWVNIKNTVNNCESESIEIIIEGYQCNYVIHPEQFIYLEKSLKSFQNENSVEIFIFNRNGGLVYNKTISTTQNFYWEGKSNTNIPTPMGAYTYLIKSGKKVSKGEITIIR